MNGNEGRNFVIIASLATVVFGVLMLLGMFLYPQYSIWEKEQSGKAQLAEATYNRQIVVEEANANLEAEKLNALAEIERAKGAAKAMEIEAGTLTAEYIQYLWVKAIDFNESTVIYIPTEAGLPILEAGNR